jgi:hypothetical protein
VHERLDRQLREHSPVLLDENRDRRRREAQLGEESVGLGRPGLDPLVWLRGPGQEVADTPKLGIEPPAHDLDPRANRAHARLLLVMLDDVGRPRVRVVRITPRLAQGTPLAK